MMMMKSLLLGSAAGLVAVAGAQAADLPVKAKPVEFVKVCSLYGAGYYYMPGTDICLKLGGLIRWQLTANPGASISNGPHSSGFQHTRVNSIDLAQRSRAMVTVDTRQQTAYGTLRTYLLLGFQQDSTAVESVAPAVYMTRGFIQMAGFTFGKATSYFDIMPGASFAYNAGFFHHPDTGDAGKMVAAYTAQLGNGISATVAMQQSSRGGTSYLSAPSARGSAEPGAVAAINALGAIGGIGTGMPDYVGNLRVDQAWGSVVVAGAMHNVSGGYYGATENLGHPADRWGWAVTGGFVFNLPMIAKGDRLAAAMVYSEGAIKYASVTPTGAGAMAAFNGNSVGYGHIPDAVYGVSPGTIELTTAWSTSGAFEHFWTPALRTSLYGSYLKVSYGAAAAAIICTSACNPDWSSWNIGSRTQWEPVRNLVMGVDVLYQKLISQTSSTGTVALAANGAKAAGTYTVADQSSWVGTFRIQRDFLP